MADVQYANNQRTLLGHPIGLYTLFFTELWERFSFYGMKALLMLYMLNEFLWTQEDASHVFAWYTGLVYFTPVFGGIIADKVLGAKKAVLYGGVLIAMGHLSLAFEGMGFFYGGLVLLILGVGLLKPNVSTQVGALYHPSDPRRDSAFTVFYMGINAGAFGGPLLCDWLRLHYGWHYGFGAAAVGMFVGLIVYMIGHRWIVPIDQTVDAPSDDVDSDAQEAAVTPVAARVQGDRTLALVIICVFAILFWVCFEQMANAMTVWADQNTNLKIFERSPDEAAVEGEVSPSAAEGGWHNFEIGAGQLQSVNPGYILLFGALFSWLWVWLDKRKKQPSSPAKMAIAVFLMAMAWGVMILSGWGENRPSSTPLASVPKGIDLSKYGATRLKYDASTATLTMNGVLPYLDRIKLLAQSAPKSYTEMVEKLADLAEKKAKEAADSGAWEASVTEDANRKRTAQAGKLPPVDAKVLGTMVPMEFQKVVDKLVSRARERKADPSGPAVTVRYPKATELPSVVQSELPDYVRWNPKTRELSATREITPEDRIAILASASMVRWNPETRTLTATAKLSKRDQKVAMAAAADPEFRAAIDSIYRQSSLFRVAVWWLFLHYMLATMGELCLSPVGLSLVTKLAPAQHTGLFMGLWFMTTGAIANFVAHTIGGMWGKMTPIDYFMIFAAVSIVATVLMVLLLRFLKKRMHGVN